MGTAVASGFGLFVCWKLWDSCKATSRNPLSESLFGSRVTVLFTCTVPECHGFAREVFSLCGAFLSV